jgi:hypothetical protein
LVATPFPAATAFLGAAPFPFLTVPFLVVAPFLAALPFVLAPPFLLALPFLAGAAWAPLRAFRARLDFEAVIRASPPVGSRLLYAVLCWPAGGPPRDRYLPPKCTVPVTATGLSVSCRLAESQILLSSD